MSDVIFKRKIYSKLKEWKETSKGKTALLLEGARRIGKSTIVEEFAQKEYRSYILIDFNEASKEVKGLFDNLMDMDYIFLFLQNIYKATLYERESVIIFDEVQQCPKARQAIKYLIKEADTIILKLVPLLVFERTAGGRFLNRDGCWRHAMHDIGDDGDDKKENLFSDWRHHQPQ